MMLLSLLVKDRAKNPVSASISLASIDDFS